MSTQLKNAGQVPELLGLSSILVGSLPATLLTEEAPDRYTVEAVFTRKANHDEVLAIQDSETRAWLSSHGFSTTELHVSDRRLEISNTNLEELRDGLAGVIADRLAEISEDVRAKQEAATARFLEAVAGEQDRAASVAVLAESVTFHTSANRMPGSGSASGQLSAATDDRARIDDWTDEGGHGR